MQDVCEAEGIGYTLTLSESIPIHIDIGPVDTMIMHRVVPGAPADVLISADFLDAYSKGYRIMLEEFAPRFMHEKEVDQQVKDHICCIEIKEKLE